MKLMVKKNGGSWSYIDDKGAVQRELQVDEAFNFSEGLSMIRLYSCIGYINEKFKVVVEPKYGVYSSCFKEGRAVVCTPKAFDPNVQKYGYIDKYGKEVIPLIFEYANSFSEGVAGVQKNDKWGVIDTRGNLVIDFKYDMLSDCVNGLFLFAIDYKIGIMDKRGNELAVSKKIDEDIFHEDIYDLFFNFENLQLVKEKDADWIIETNQGKVKLIRG
jgi:hypothetical protein